MVCLHLIRLGRLVRHSTLSIQAKHCFGNKNGSCQDRSGDQSESELWLRNASDREGGNISAFEDEFGNHLRPTGQLTDSFPLRTAKSRALRNKVSILC